jgi:hypothetical protein
MVIVCMLQERIGYHGLCGNMLYLAALKIWAFMVIMATVCICRIYYMDINAMIAAYCIVCYILSLGIQMDDGSTMVVVIRGVSPIFYALHA